MTLPLLEALASDRQILVPPSLLLCKGNEGQCHTRYCFWREQTSKTLCLLQMAQCQQGSEYISLASSQVRVLIYLCCWPFCLEPGSHAFAPFSAAMRSQRTTIKEAACFLHRGSCSNAQRLMIVISSCAMQASNFPCGYPHPPAGHALGPVPGPLSGAGRGGPEGLL